MTKNKNLEPVKSIYTDIDTLLDTRLPVIYNAAPGIFRKIVDNKSYFNRHKDVFDALDSETFTSLYDSRTKLLLNLAGPTYIYYFIRERYAELVTDMVNCEIRDRIVLYINTFPYMLTPDEQDNIVELFKRLISIDIPIRIVEMSNYDLTPSWIKDHVDTMYKYDFVNWLDIYTANEEILRQPLLETLVIAPALVADNVPNKDIDKAYIEKMMYVYRTLVQPMLIDPYYFSHIMPDDGKNPLRE